MAITMYQSDRNFVTPANDASLYSALGGDTSGVLRRGNMLNITTSGLTATVDTGQVVVLGRLVEVTTPTQVTLPANSQGQLCIVIDLSKTNSVSGSAGNSDYSVTVNQVYLATVTGSLTQDDINNGGFIYELPLGTFSTSATSATVSQHNPMLNDTGWINLPHDPSVGFNTSSSYLQYRVRDNVVFIRWNGISVLNAPNFNQLGNIPVPYRPDVEFSAASVDMGGDGVIYPINTHVNETGTLWVEYQPNHGGALAGYISYPI